MKYSPASPAATLRKILLMPLDELNDSVLTLLMLHLNTYDGVTLYGSQSEDVIGYIAVLDRTPCLVVNIKAFKRYRNIIENLNCHVMVTDNGAYSFRNAELEDLVFMIGQIPDRKVFIEWSSQMDNQYFNVVQKMSPCYVKFSIKKFGQRKFLCMYAD